MAARWQEFAEAQERSPNLGRGQNTSGAEKMLLGRQARPNPYGILFPSEKAQEEENRE